MARAQVPAAVRNAREPEALFVEHGFVLLRPEQLPFAEQVELFAGADMVAGYGGRVYPTASSASGPGRRVR